MTVQISQVYQFVKDSGFDPRQLQWELTNIAQTLNNANAGLLSLDHLNVTTRVFTASGNTTASSESILVVKKGTGAATGVTLPASPLTGWIYIVKDGKGDANTNNITVSPASGTIDGAATKVINTAYGVLRVVYNGTEWSAI